MNYNHNLILMKRFFRPFSALLGVMSLLYMMDIQEAWSQSQLNLQAFEKPAKGWQEVGDVSLNFAKPQVLTVRPGSGVLAHVPARRVVVEDLVTTAEYGNVELELEYLVAAGSTALISLQDVYDITLNDGQGDLYPTAFSNGGVLGYAPRQQVSKAPGLWQTLKLVFKAAEFDQNGVKTVPARLLSAQLNGVTIHENIQLRPRTGVSEQARGPIRFGSIDGAIAFRDIKVSEPDFDQAGQRPQRGNQPNPILVDAETTRVLRSFMDIPGGIRVVHAVSVGHPQQVHYTYDMDHGTLVQAWRGDFLDATPMWHSRGNGTARVMGSPIYFGKPGLAIAQLSSRDAAWPSDTSGTGYRPKGYRLDKQERPTFQYELHGTTVDDQIVPLPHGEGLTRTIQVANTPDNLYLQLATGSTIEEQGNGVYLIEDKSWFIRLDDSGKDKPFIRDYQDGKELLIPVRGSVRYSIIF